MEAQASKTRTRFVVVESGNADMPPGSKSQQQVDLFLEEGEALCKREHKERRVCRESKGASGN